MARQNRKPAPAGSAIARVYADGKGEIKIPPVADWGEPVCMACGFHQACHVNKGVAQFAAWSKACKTFLERAHIVPWSITKRTDPAAYVLLCKHCHDESPSIACKTAFERWIMNRKDDLLHDAARIIRRGDANVERMCHIAELAAADPASAPHKYLEKIVCLVPGRKRGTTESCVSALRNFLLEFPEFDISAAVSESPVVQKKMVEVEGALERRRLSFGYNADESNHNLETTGV